jgi:hypothetical protein
MATGFVNEAVKGKKEKEKQRRSRHLMNTRKTRGVRFPYADV